MIRQHVAMRQDGHHNGVPWRSHEVARIEALSDAMFAFAITLLIVALEVPQTFSELWEKMEGFVAFAIGFAIIFQIWYNQHSFFRRFGLQDVWTITLNGALLFVVLFYVYPLKFLFTLVVNEFAGGKGTVHERGGEIVPMLANERQAEQMMLIYGIGFAAVYGIFVLLFAHVLRRKTELDLGEDEVFDARVSLEQNALMLAVGAIATLAALLPGFASNTGLLYLLVGPVIGIQRTIRGRQRRRLFEGDER